MTFLSRIFGKKSTTDQKSKDVVVFDDIQVTVTRRDGTQETLFWSDLEEVAIVTTDEGPLVDDMFFVLFGSSRECRVSKRADGAMELLGRLQELPGFRNETALQAMGSTENARFLCWSKGSAL
jgi:hypothetical protein